VIFSITGAVVLKLFMIHETYIDEYMVICAAVAAMEV
jgi:hypothetical protein